MACSAGGPGDQSCWQERYLTKINYKHNTVGVIARDTDGDI
jgi:isoaspartyl peptidase/L-asparaginase-like protein (Ntn-hydrolase superfamily)